MLHKKLIIDYLLRVKFSNIQVISLNYIYIIYYMY